MNILLMLVISIIIFFLGYRFYGRYIEKVFGIDGTCTTPACELNDGVDYVPTRKFVVFSHHFSSIAGGGPIIGPCVAFIFGYLPIWLWVVLGTVLMGAVHDFSALLASMKEKGRSMAEIAEKSFGRTGFLLFVGFIIIMLLMVTSVFLSLTATALSSKYALSQLGVEHTRIHTVIENGVTYAVVGGIASTSVIIITLFAPLFGILLYKKKIKTYKATILAIIICAVSIEVGIRYPISIDPFIWMIIISIYTLIAAGIPVWIVLQPRDFTNSFLLYGGIICILICTVIIGASGGTINAPATNFAQANLHLGYIWPILFITIACGAISGFHSLVSGGTSSKQIENERPDACAVGYGGMVLEGVLALGVIIAVGVGLDFDKVVGLIFPAAPGVKSNPVLAFALGMGGMLNKASGLPIIYGAIFGILMVEGFVVTSLDTAVRLNRYLFEELWAVIFKNVPKLLKTYLFNSFLCVIIMFVLAYFNAFKHLWALFGSANQLLAALTLITVSIWLMKKGKKYLFALIPGIFMFVTTIGALILILVKDYIPGGNIMLSTGDIVLIILSIGVVVLAVKTVRSIKSQRQD